MFARGSGRYLAVGMALLLALLGLAVTQRGPWLVTPFAYLPFLGFLLWFFRDPDRVPGEGIVSPADGKVLGVQETPHGSKLSIFMAPTSVHVNRAPQDGRVVRTEYRRGSHVPAFRKDSQRNERFDLDLETARGVCHIALIAGTLARRIHPYVEPGNAIKKGDRIGLISFGSRCELVLPQGRHRWVVAPGQWVKAGQTTIAREE